MNEIVCECCKKPFLGRANRKTCSIRCRRILEGKRRFWDHKFSYVHLCEINANWDTHSADVRAHWQKEADEAREKLLKVYGNRP
jgi:hypothetical protein